MWFAGDDRDSVERVDIQVTSVTPLDVPAVQDVALAATVRPHEGLVVRPSDDVLATIAEQRETNAVSVKTFQMVPRE